MRDALEQQNKNAKPPLPREDPPPKATPRKMQKRNHRNRETTETNAGRNDLTTKNGTAEDEIHAGRETMTRNAGQSTIPEAPCRKGGNQNRPRGHVARIRRPLKFRLRGTLYAL